MMRLLLVLLTATLVSCSKYQTDFHAAAKDFKQGDTPAGPWKGTWKSEVNGHTGPLWCLVTPNKKDPKEWHFRYRAGWGVFEFGDYLHKVPAQLQKDGSLPLNAKMELPNNFGTYQVKGKLTAKEFKARFEGNGDKGTMTLARP